LRIPLRQSLYHHALRLTGNHCDAEDLLQDKMIKTYAGFINFGRNLSQRG